MAPGEGDTWHGRCHTHRLQHVIDVREEDMGGRVIHPPPIKFAIEKKNKGNKKNKNQWRE